MLRAIEKLLKMWYIQVVKPKDRQGGKNMHAEVSAVKVNGFSMGFFRFGEGSTPFVMLPGIYTKPITILAPLVAEAYAAFAEQFTVYVPDRRSDLPNGYTIEDSADDTAAVLDELGIKNACVFGVSMGGMTAQALSAKRPDLVGKLVLSSTASRISPQTRQNISEMIALAESGDIDALLLRFAKSVYTPSFFEKYKEPILASLQGSSQADIDRFVTLSKGILNFDIYDKLGRISCPTLVIGAGKDEMLGVQASKDIAEKAGAELYIYENYGHAAYDEAPDYKDRLLEFFTR